MAKKRNTEMMSTLLEVGAAPAPALPSLALDEGERPATHAEVYYWRELCGVLHAAGVAGVRESDWPADLAPSRHTLQQMEQRRLLVRRSGAWHLRRHWYTRLAALKQHAIPTPPLVPSDRPAPDLPTYSELEAWETICRWLDTQMGNRAYLPFVGLCALGAASETPAFHIKRMRRYRLVRHTERLDWALSPHWKDRLRALWRGVITATREYTPPAPDAALPQSMAAGIDTWHLNWLVDEALPAHLREQLDDWQEHARAEEEEIATELQYDGAPLVMYRSGTKAEHGGGVSWGYVLLNRSLRLLIRKAPLGGIIAQARLGSECLWRRTSRAALDELDALVRRMWRTYGTKEARWQVSQVHLAHDVVRFPLELELLARVVSRSRTQATYEAARREIERAQAAASSDTDSKGDLPLTIDWDAEFADDDPFSAFALSDFDGDEADRPIEDTPVEERAASVYRWGRRLSGITWSPGGAISCTLYLKRLESLLRGKVHMFPIWQAAGWDGEAEVTRVEARMRRDALRELRLPVPASDSSTGHVGQQLQVVLDDPWQMLEHQQDIWAAAVGRVDEQPEAINVAWIRVVTPREGDANRSRWDTDPTWRVVQAAQFTAAPVTARRMVRRTQRTHDVEVLDRLNYGALVTRVALLHPEGGQWDVTQAIRDAVPALVKESEKPAKDFGSLVRERRKLRGLPVPPVEKVLPHRSHTTGESLPADFDEELSDSPDTVGQLRIRVRIAEFRVRQAMLKLEEAERTGASSRELDELESAYLCEVTTCAAARDVLHRHQME